MKKRLSLSDRIAGLGMVAALALGAPAAAVQTDRDPAKKAYASVVKDLLKAQKQPKDNGPREFVRPNIERRWRRRLERVFKRVTGKTFTARQWKMFRKGYGRGWVPRKHEQRLGVQFLVWVKRLEAEQESKQAKAA